MTALIRPFTTPVHQPARRALPCWAPPRLPVWLALVSLRRRRASPVASPIASNDRRAAGCRQLRPGPAGADSPEPDQRSGDLAGRLRRGGAGGGGLADGGADGRRVCAAGGGALPRRRPSAISRPCASSSVRVYRQACTRPRRTGPRDYAAGAPRRPSGPQLEEERAHHRLVRRHRRRRRRGGGRQEGRADRRGGRWRRRGHLGSGDAPALDRRPSAQGRGHAPLRLAYRVGLPSRYRAKSTTPDGPAWSTRCSSGHLLHHPITDERAGWCA